MATLKIDAYYDLTCTICASHRSTDFSYGWEMNRAVLIKRAHKEGWRAVKAPDGNIMTLCPICAARCDNCKCFSPDGEKDSCEMRTANGFCRPVLEKNISENPSSRTMFV